MTCLSGSAQAQQETSTMYTAEAMVMLKSRCLKERQMLEISWWLVSVQGSIYAIRRPESILKPVNQQYRENIYQLETKRKGKMPCTENINTHGTSGWCVHITFSYGDVFDPLEMYCGIDCVERFMEHNKDGVMQLSPTFPQQPMTEFTGVVKTERKASEKFHLWLKEFDAPDNRKVKDYCHYTGLHQGAGI